MLKFNGSERNLADKKFHQWRFDVFLKLSLTRPATDKERKRLGDGITMADPDTRLPSDEFVDFCTRMGSDVWVSETYTDGCAVYVDPKIVPTMLLTWEFPKKHLQVGHAMFPNLVGEEDE